MNSHKYLGCIIIALYSFLICESALAADPPLPTPVGRVVWVKGVFKAQMANNEERTLQKMSVIYLNDTLVTEANTQAQIAFTDDTLMTFRPETKFKIENYQFDRNKKSGSVGKYVMNLIEGGFRTVTGLIAKRNPDDYRINTPVATIGVRGTDYTVYVRNNDFVIGFYKGSPCVTSAKNQLCLDGKTRYARVPGAGEPPVALSERPAIFLEELPIISVKIDPFVTPGGSTGTTKTDGPISNFCITS